MTTINRSIYNRRKRGNAVAKAEPKAKKRAA